MSRSSPSSCSAFQAWSDLHVWLIEERRVAAQKSANEPDHLGYRGELVALRKMIKKVNASKWQLRG